MCFNTIASYFQAKAAQKAQNESAIQTYKFQQQQQRLVIKASQEQLREELSRQRVESQRAAAQSFDNAQASIVEMRRRQAASVANASSAGITGTPLSALFNDYQASIGGVATNLQQTYSQINENLFFNADNSRREAQSRMNSATPAPPYLAKSPPILPYVFAGMGEIASYVRGGGGGSPGTYTPQGSSSPSAFGGGGSNLGDFEAYSGGFA